MPGNSASRCAAITCSRGTKRSPSGTLTKRGSSGGTLTRAKRSSPVAGSRTIDREVERQVRDVRERVRGVDGERREHREDAVVEHACRGVRASSASSSSQLREADAGFLERGRDLLGEHRRPGGSHSSSTRARIARSCSTWSRPSGDGGAQARRELLLEPGDPHLEELVEVLAEDREELGPLEQRERGVLGEREHPRVEVEPRELAVQVAGAVGDAGVRRPAGSMRLKRSGFADPRALLRYGRARLGLRRCVCGPGSFRPGVSTMAGTDTSTALDSPTHAVRPARDRTRHRDGGRRLRHGVARGLALLRRAASGAARRRCCCTSCSRWRRSPSSRRCSARSSTARRGGRRLMVAASMAGRAVLCVLMASKIDSPLLYPLAFGALVLSKGQTIAKSALVPAVVDSHDELVLANSRLALIAVVGATVPRPIAAVILQARSARRGYCAPARVVFVVRHVRARSGSRGPRGSGPRRRSTNARRCTRAASSSPEPRWVCCAASSASSRSSPRSR